MLAETTRSRVKPFKYHPSSLPYLYYFLLCLLDKLLEDLKLFPLFLHLQATSRLSSRHHLLQLCLRHLYLPFTLPNSLALTLNLLLPLFPQLSLVLHRFLPLTLL
jgi:hypothetical protein